MTTTTEDEPVNHHHLHFHSWFPLDLRTVQTETARCRAVWAPHGNHRATVLTVARWVVMVLHHHQRTAARRNRARPRGRASRDVRHPLVIHQSVVPGTVFEDVIPLEIC